MAIDTPTGGVPRPRASRRLPPPTDDFGELTDASDPSGIGSRVADPAEMADPRALGIPDSRPVLPVGHLADRDDGEEGESGPIATSGRVKGGNRARASTRARTGRHRRAGLVDGRYELEELISKGGMGRVFKARHRDLGRKVALKLVLDGFQDDQELRELFFKEARLASALSHPSIINVTDFGLDDELGYFVVMDLLEGETLRERMRKNRLQLRFIFDTIDQIAGAVRYIHGRDIVHCDLKPENIYLTKIPNEPRRSNEVKLLDFGLSWRRETMPDAKLGGTPPYLAPERLRGQPPSPLCDVYSLGMILYEMIAGKLPYSGTVPQMIEQQLTGPMPPPPSSLSQEPLDERADALVMRAIAKNPAHRHASTEAFQFELRAVIGMMGFKARRAPQNMHAAPSAAPATPDTDAALRLITESPVPLALFDQQGGVKLANRAFIEALEGVHVPVTSFNELAVTRRHSDLHALFQRMLDGGPAASRVVLAGAEGDERSTILWMAPYLDGTTVAGVHMTIVPSGA